MMKKIIAMLLLISLVLVAGCGKKKEAAADPDAPLTYWCTLQTVHSTSISNLGDLDFYKVLQEKTGVEVEFIHPPAGQETEQLNLMLSSRDYPDIIETTLTARDGGAAKAISDKFIIPLNDIIKENAPNYYKLLEDNKNLKKAFSTDAGEIFAFGGIVSDPYLMSGGLMVRQDMLDELGLDTPKTLDDWENYFKLLKEKGIETPFTTDKYRMETAMLFLNAYGIGPAFYLDEAGQVKYGPAQPEFKDYLTRINDWFKKGYIDNGLFTNTQSICEAKMLNNETGAFYGFIGGTMGRLLPSVTDESFKLIGVPNPHVSATDTRKTFANIYDLEEGAKYGFHHSSNAALTTKNKNVEKSAKLLDYLYTEEGWLLKNYGIEGKTYNMKDGVPTYTDLILKDADGLPIADAMAKYFRASYPNPGFINDPYYYEQYYSYPEQKESLKIFTEDARKAHRGAMPPISTTVEESEEVASILSTINTYKTEMFSKFIMGTESLDNFDKYIKTLNDMGLPRVIEIYSKAVERYNNK